MIIWRVYWMIKGIIFDLDGTLLDTLEDIADSANEALVASGFEPHPLNEYRFFVGNGVENLVKMMLPKDTQQQVIDRVIDGFQQAYNRNYANKCQPYPGIMSLIDELIKRGYKMGVCSNKPDAFTQVMVDLYFKDVDFVAVTGERKDLPRKPNAAMVHFILDKMDLGTDECLFIGDSDVDVKTANNAGLKSVGVEWGFRPIQELIDANVTYTVSHPKEILDLLENDLAKNVV
ncbi:MAG: HAD-IIIA family hydrolase [Erysipelotrichaceae bacterium]|jgi:phosphoglycolate phosphatase|nr:HAD-IIIA family hydrolase [Erysipelotrichaceae bacterium]